MEISVHGKQIDIGNSLRSHVTEMLKTSASKYFSSPINASITFTPEAHLYSTNITVHVGKGIIIQGHAAHADIYQAYNLALEKIEKRLRRHKRKLKDHHRNQTDDYHVHAAQQYILANPTEEEPTPDEGDTNTDSQPIIIAEMATEILHLTVSEAVMRMDLSDQNALMFRNTAHGQLNMIYRRNDGNLGWIDPHSKS